MTETARLRLPEIAAAQAQKHVTHNEALTGLDTLVQLSVLDKDLTAPPGSPAEGDCYIVAATATGDWTGWEDRIARYEDGAWRSYLPGAGDGIGWLAWVQDEDILYVLKVTGWEAFSGGGGLGGTTGTTDNALLRADGTGGDTVQGSAVTIDDTGAMVITASGTAGFSVTSTDAGSGAGPIFDLYRDSPSPAASDIVGTQFFYGRDTAAAKVTYGYVAVQIEDATAGSHDASMSFVPARAGATSAAYGFYMGDGVKVGIPAGAYKGVGTLNASAVYDDNVLLTCPALQREFIETGSIDLAKWDALVPDRVIPAETTEVPDEIEVTKDVVTLRKETDGSLTRVVKREGVKVQKVDCIPVYDEAGNGIDMIERPVTRTVTTPGRTIGRRHEVAHLFQRMLDDGFDPRDPKQYFAKLVADQALPGMPSEADWEHAGLSLGELASRKWLAMEFLALVVMNHENRISALEAAHGP